MSRATECFSMYSDMSIRTIALSLSKRNSARARASSVFPTPVGPTKMNEPMGRCGSPRPARARRTAFEIAAIASSCPTTRSRSRSSIRTSFSFSPRPGGRPGCRSTRRPPRRYPPRRPPPSASSVPSGSRRDGGSPCRAPSAAPRGRRSGTRRPWRDRPRAPRSPRAPWRPRSRGRPRIRAIAAFSASQCARIPSRDSFSSASWRSIFFWRSRDALSSPCRAPAARSRAA